MVETAETLATQQQKDHEARVAVRKPRPVPSPKTPPKTPPAEPPRRPEAA